MARRAFVLVTGALFAAGCTPARDRCTPATCEALGKNCGAVDDGCGATLACGACEAPLTCGADNVCVAEACTDACSEGARRCDGGAAYRECGRGSSGCLEWLASVACPPALVCSGGGCAALCSEQCTAGATQCSGNGVQTCRRMPSGCTDWDGPVACAAGRACSGGRCVETCSDQCTDGALRCSGSGVQTCRRMSSGCTDWDAAVACPGAHDICSGGRCVATCSDQCTEGAAQCSGTGVQTCRRRPSGCVDWDTPVPCADGTTCSGGACVRTCRDQCTAGARQCSGTGLQTCRRTSSGCTDWDTAEPCGPQLTCSGASCVATCSDQCLDGAARCSGTGVQTCRRLPSGCTDWDTPAACTGAHEACAGGVCVPTCVDACSAGAKQCSGNGVRTCRTMPSGCLGWDVAVACTGAHEECSDGLCVPSCVDRCSAGATQCSGTRLQTCRTMPSGCTDWDTPAACEGAHEVCSGGLCVATCSDQCSPGATRCSGDAVQTCRTMPSGCTDWDTAVACSGPHEACSGGTCLATCSDVCDAGATRCADAGVQTCRTMASGCRDWDGSVACSGAHEVCREGACVATCEDRCTAGAKRCASGGVESCGTAPSGCTAWSAPVACTGPHEECSAGACVATCSDKCAAGATRCSGTSVQRCGTMPSGCTDWSAAAACAGAREQCIGSACAVAWSVGGEAQGVAGTGLVLANGQESLGVEASGPFTFVTRVADGASYGVTVKTQPAWGQCTVAGGSGSATADVTNIRVTCVPVVQALYPKSGRNWGNFVQNDGPTPVRAADRACYPYGIGAWTCVHGGELRQVAVAGRSSCAGLSASDALGAFEWQCDDATTPVRMVSTGLKEGRGLADLVDFAAIAWRPNAVAVVDGSGTVTATQPAAWWTNPVVNLPESKTTSSQADYGKVFVVAANRRANFEMQLTDGAALVVAPGATFSGDGNSLSSAVTSAGNFNWIEGTFEGNGAESAVRLLGSRFNIVHRVRVRGGWSMGLELETWFSTPPTSNLLRDVVVGGSDRRRTGVVINGGKGNVVRRLVVTDSLAGVSESASSSDNRYEDVELRDNTGDGASLAGARARVRGLRAAKNGGSGLVLGGAGAVATDLALGDHSWTGLVVKGADSVIANVFSTLNGFRPDGWTQPKSTSGVHVLGSNVLLFNVATLDSHGSVGGVLVETGGACTLSDLLLSEIRVYDGWNYVSALTVYNAPGTRFSGLLKIGSQGNPPCYAVGSAPGVTAQCAPVAPSDHVLSSADARSSFVCLPAGAECGWAVKSTDTVAREALALPTGNDVLTHRWKDGTSATFLRRAVELAGDGLGDDDALCESNEACLFTPNLGSYQGHGALASAGTFVDGTLRGIVLKRFETNGR